MLLFHRCPPRPGAAPQRKRAASLARLARGWSKDGAAALDDVLSARPLELDPSGYFLIAVDHDNGTITAKHYANTINEAGARREGTVEPLYRKRLATCALSHPAPSRLRLRPAQRRGHPLQGLYGA